MPILQTEIMTKKGLRPQNQTAAVIRKPRHAAGSCFDIALNVPRCNRRDIGIRKSCVRRLVRIPVKINLRIRTIILQRLQKRLLLIGNPGLRKAVIRILLHGIGAKLRGLRIRLHHRGVNVRGHLTGRNLAGILVYRHILPRRRIGQRHFLPGRSRLLLLSPVHLEADKGVRILLHLLRHLDVILNTDAARKAQTICAEADRILLLSGVIRIRKLQLLLREQLPRVCVITIGNSIHRKSLRCIRIIRTAGQEKTIRIPGSALIAIRHIDQIVLPILHVCQIPLVSAAVHLTGHRCNLNLRARKRRQLAQILKCLRVALTDNLGLRIPIKHIQKIPRTAVIGLRRAAGRRGCIVIIHKITDLIQIVLQLPVIRPVTRRLDNASSLVRRLLSGPGFRHINRIRIFPAELILHPQRNRNAVLGKLHSSLVILIAEASVSDSSVRPVGLIREIRHKRITNQRIIHTDLRLQCLCALLRIRLRHSAA